MMTPRPITSAAREPSETDMIATLKAQAGATDEEIEFLANQQKELFILKMKHQRQSAEFRLKKIVEANATHLEQHKRFVESHQKESIPVEDASSSIAVKIIENIIEKVTENASK